jgi:hypothetical protein
LHIRQICVTLGSTLIPAEHRVDDRLQLLLGGLVDTARVHPAILYAIFGSSVYAEEDLGVAAFVLARARHQLIIRDFLAF